MALPVTGQPGGATWMQVPQQIPGCPPGLEYLTMIDQVLCHQVVELLQAFTGWETNNKYVIKNSMGQQVYYAFEETNLCMRLCCTNQREFTMHIVDNNNKEVMRIFRPFKCCAGCCWCADACMCCAHETFVEAPPGSVIGRIRQLGASCDFKYAVQDPEGNTNMVVKGCCCACRCCCDVNFPVYTKDESNQIGSVTKQWSGVVRETFTQADNFGITFPMDLDVKMKATLLGAMFLIDFMAFERQNN